MQKRILFELTDAELEAMMDKAYYTLDLLDIEIAKSAYYTLRLRRMFPAYGPHLPNPHHRGARQVG